MKSIFCTDILANFLACDVYRKKFYLMHYNHYINIKYDRIYLHMLAYQFTGTGGIYETEKRSSSW